MCTGRIISMHLTGQYNWTITRYVVAQFVKGFFGQFSLRILLRSCLADPIASKPRDCGLEFNRRLFSPLISLSFKKCNWKLLRIVDHYLVKTIFGDFRQTILYFGLSIWTHIKYRIQFRTMTNNVLLFQINYMYTFSQKK